MKYIFFCFCFFYYSISIAQNNSLVVLSADGNSFQLKVDDVSINKKDEAIVKARGLSAGKHSIEIWQIKNGTESVYKDSITIGKEEKFINKEFTFVVSQEKNKQQALQFKSVSELSGPIVPIVAEVPKEKVPVIDNNLYGSLYRTQNNKPIFFNHYTATTKSCDSVLSNRDLDYALQLISNCNDPELQNRYALSITENNCYTCTQYKSLLALLPMDIEKLTAAKLAYTHLTDKQNSSLISQSFKYQSMKETFSNFIQTENTLHKQESNDCSKAIDTNIFDIFFNTLKSTTSEYDKWRLSKSFVLKNCINVEQAKNIINTFLHDREKLDFLKSAYKSIVDKGNAKQLTSELQSETDKKEFSDFISTYEK